MGGVLMSNTKMSLDEAVDAFRHKVSAQLDAFTKKWKEEANRAPEDFPIILPQPEWGEQIECFLENNP